MSEEKALDSPLTPENEVEQKDKSSKRKRNKKNSTSLKKKKSEDSCSTRTGRNNNESTKERLRSVFSQFKFKNLLNTSSPSIRDKKARESERERRNRSREDELKLKDREDSGFVPVVVPKPGEEVRLSGEKIIPPSNFDEPICNEVYGYGFNFPNSMLEEPKTFEYVVQPMERCPILVCTRSLMVLEVPPNFKGKIEHGDLLFKFNGSRLANREDYVQKLRSVTKFRDMNQSCTLSYTILRPLRNAVVPKEDLGKVVPQGFELMPDHFEYLYAYLIVTPKSILGLTIKAYNGKVFVSGLDNNFSSMAFKCLLVGDAILKIDDHIIGGVKDADEQLSATFTTSKDKKFVKVLIERPRSQAALQQVKLALTTEKTYEVNPRMGDDISDICNRQISQLLMNPWEPPGKPILKNHQKRSNANINVSAYSAESPIFTDVNNVTLLAPTPAVPSVPAGTMGSFDPLGLGKKRPGKNSKPKLI
uniref:PDZ domain-containing protein n=1 Tax=Panagrolaimus sp. JU765 TaxID=591449 RepID=A0AC34RSC0_9BILA